MAKIKKPRPGKKPAAKASAEVWKRYADREAKKMADYRDKLKAQEKAMKEKETAKKKVEAIRSALGKL